MNFKTTPQSFIGFVLFSMFLLAYTGIAYSSEQTHPDVERLINSGQEPEGIVFEIETLDANALVEQVSYIKSLVEKVKKRYPEVDVAVVSHGTEEYALQKSESNKNAELHNVFNQMVNQSDVSVHVCGAIAGLNKLSQEDFPEFVSYSESGLAQINDYKALDYEIIVIKQLTSKQRKALFEQPEKFIMLK